MGTARNAFLEFEVVLVETQASEQFWDPANQANEAVERFADRGEPLASCTVTGGRLLTGRYCCKKILRIQASNIDSRSRADAQC
jgi:hypothetical protein